MRRFAPPVPRQTAIVRLFSGIFVAVALAFTTLSAQIPGRNVNMVAGNTWPDGDPFLQRQNEPSIAASTRNPLHLLAGSNDYRTVDLPGLAADETGDAWLGVFKSFDGGQRWTSTLLPGYPQDHSALGTTSPIHGYGAAADPVVRAGTNGLFYYAGLAFDRSSDPTIPGKSAIFVARFIDNNNKEAGNTFEYIGTRTMQTEKGGRNGDFLDKPWMVVDIPRDPALRCTIVTPGEKGPVTQSIPAGPVYIAYTVRWSDRKGPRYDIMFSRSIDCGNSWSTPVQLNADTERANQGATMSIDPRNGNVLIAWRSFEIDGVGTDGMAVAKYTPTGMKIDRPGFARKFAKAKKGNGKGLDAIHFYERGGVNRALDALQLAPLDQSTSALQIRFRTNAYPAMTIDENGRIYMVWTERGYDPNNADPTVGSARVLMATSTNGSTWTTAKPVSNENQKGHQLMPAITYAGGKLMLIYYDIRESRAQSFTQYIDDKSSFDRTTPEATGRRQTIDLRASMAAPGATPVFEPSVAVSEYIEGPRVQHGPNVPWQVNPPNLPMFQKGTAPFIGDYVDIAAAPNFVLDGTGKWVYNNTASTTPPIFHAAWTDNRDVRVPLEDRDGDGNPWNDYTPPGMDGSMPSVFDPTQTVPMCIPGNAGSRNQNIYTARITGGLLAGSPGNNKRLGYRQGSATELMERRFVVFAQNTSDDAVKRFRMTITNQPVGGRASWDQFSAAPLTVIEADVPRRSTASRTVYATSTDPHAQITINIAELTLINNQWVVKSGGLSSNVLLNPDIDNPDIDNPDIDNPDIDNPDIDNIEIFNPDIDNPDIDNPDIDNPDIDNPDIDNPDIDNVEVANPDIDNPDIDNPDIDNPDIDNPDIDNPDIDNPDIDNASLMSDVTWNLTNTGNTTAAYNVNLFFAQQQFDPAISTQLILYRTYKTPVVQNCVLKTETRNMLVANVPNPQLVHPGGNVSDPNDPAATNATIYLAPGESARITLRVFDPHPDPAKIVTVTNPDGTTGKIVNAFVPNEDVTPVVQQQAVDTESKDEGQTEPPIVVQFPPPQTVTDTASTAENTPVKLNVLANDSTAFGSTKVISFHPDGMAAHSGGGPGDLVFQPSTGFVYTQRGAVDPNTNNLVGRFNLPSATSGTIWHTANPRTGINYGRTGVLNGGVFALDARPDSATFHQYLAMPAISDQTLGMAVDTVHNRLYVVHGPSASTAVTPTTLSIIDVSPSSPSFHTVIGTVSLPAGVRAQSVAVNSRTQKVYVAVTNQAPNVGGVYVFDVNNAAAGAVRLAGTSGSWALAINEASNLVFATSSVGNPQSLVVYAIDGATNAVASIPTGYPMRFGPNEERMVIHEASGKVFIRLEHVVVIFDGQRGSPTRNTVLTAVNVGHEFGGTDIAIDQERGLVVTVGNVDFQADIIDVATNSLANTVSVNGPPTDVAIDPRSHRAFVSMSLSYVQEIDLTTLQKTDAIPVYIESGSVLLNPLTNKAYAGLLSLSTGLLQLSGAGNEGPISDPLHVLPTAGRFLFSAWHNATNRGFIVNQGNTAGTNNEDGSVILIDGATNSVEAVEDTMPNPFGIGIDQATGGIYVAHLSGPPSGAATSGTHGGILIADANDLNQDASFAVGPNGIDLPDGFTLPNPGALLGFGRHVVVNPTTHKVYIMQIGSGLASLAVLDPVTKRLTPLDGQPGTPVYDYLNPGACGGVNQPACQTYGRAQVMRVDASLNKVLVGYWDSPTNVYRIVALDGATHAVTGVITAGSHSQRHTASYIAVNEAANEFYVVDYAAGTIRKYDTATLAPIGAAVALPPGPSAMAYNVTAKRIYVSSIDAKILTAIDAASMQIISSVKLPLVAYFLFVDEVEGRIYTSGGDSPDESGAMIVTDVLGELGTNVNVTAVSNPSQGGGAVVLNADNSVTYTPAPGFSGPDQFNYTISAPTGTAIGSVHINVVPSIPAVTAFGDGYFTLSGQMLNVGAPGPLANDATGTSATQMVVENQPGHGQLVPQSDGAFTYLPDAGFSGVDTFTYHADTDSMGSTNTVTVTIAVADPTSLVVTNTNDSGAGSLRAAMTNAQIEPGSTISFAIPGAGPHTISVASALPVLTQPTILDGYTQPGAQVNTAAIGTNAVIKIAVRGQGLPSNTSGIVLQGGNSIVRGLAIGNFTASGIFMELAGGNHIEGNFIGTDASGLAAAPNGLAPVPPSTSPSGAGITSRSPNNVIGAATLAGRNLISGNLSTGIRVDRNSTVAASNGNGTVIVNNLIGTNATGNAALANGQAVPVSGNGIFVQVPNVTIGGSTALTGNVIAGNNGSGISSSAQTTGSNPQIVLAVPSGLTVQGNFIGVRADGSAALANTSTGVTVVGANAQIGGAANTTPGGACTGACNVISGNGGNAVTLSSSTDATGAVPVLMSSAAGSIVEGNYVGVSPAGTARFANGGSGVALNAAGIRVGGNTPGQRNVISGNNSFGVSAGVTTATIGGVTTVVASAANAIITGNYIGLDTTGQGAIGNNSSAVSISVPGVRVGGTSAGERNVIGSNGGTAIVSFASTSATNGAAPPQIFAVPSGLTIQGNYIGVAADGSTGRANGAGISVAGANTTIGGTVAGAGNVISGNASNGISVNAQFENSNPAFLGAIYTQATNAVIQGNIVGLNAAGTAAVGNTSTGISVNVPGATIGGTVPGARNVISGNNQNGVSFGAHFVTSTNAVVTSGSGATVKGNYIGVRADGAVAIGNGFVSGNGSGITVSAPNVTIGGPNATDRNLISGNNVSGISSFAARNNTTVLTRPDSLVVEGNWVGINAAGNAAIANVGGGMIISGQNSIVRGNVISGNTGAGTPAGLNVSVNWESFNAGNLGTIYSSTDGTEVVGNIIGLDPTGTTAIPNDWGMFLNGPNVTVGGNNAALRNVISGNNRSGISAGTNFVTSTNTPVASAAGSVIKGNYIGLNAAGTGAIFNAQGGIQSSAANVTIGGPAASDGNFVIANLNYSAIGLSRQTNGAAVINTGNSQTVQHNVLGLLPDLTTRLNARGTPININTAGNQILDNTIAGNGTGAVPTTVAIGIFPAAPGAGNGNVIRGNYIGTTAAGATGLHNFGAGISMSNVDNTVIENNTLVGGNDIGVFLSASPGATANNTQIKGNRIGVMPDGQTAQDPAHPVTAGIHVNSNGGTISGTVIGTSNVNDRNIIGGMTLGNAIGLYNAGVSNTTIEGNYIGVAGDGITARSNNFAGVHISGSSDNTVANNLLSNNVQYGIGVNAGGVRNRFQGNRIFNNGGLGIDLDGNGAPNLNDNGDGDAGANNLQNFPVLTGVVHNAVTRVTIDTSSFANVPNGYTIEFFANTACDANGYGEGRRVVGGRAGIGVGAAISIDLNERVPDGEFITATATDPNGNTSEFSACLSAGVNPLLVTNTNDSGAGSLRDAMTFANAAPGSQTITFNIPGAGAASPAVISLASPLPVISEPVTIDGRTQPGYDGKPVIEVSGQNAIANGFETAPDVISLTVAGLSITRFTGAGVFLMQSDSAPGGGSVVTQNFIGTDRFGNAGKGNTVGVVARSDSSNINSNVLSGNVVGVRLENDADNVVVSSNKIGMMDDGITARPNSEDGIRMYDSLNNNIITNNIISKNGWWGINIQDSLAGDVFGTMIYGNTIGLDASGNVAGNLGGGVRLENAPATDLGLPGGPRNVISGNGGPNPPDIGVGVQVIGPGAVNIRNNYIGLDPTGVLRRSNNNKGIVLDGVAAIGGTAIADRNYISGNGDIAGGAGIIINPSVVNGTIIQGNVIGLNVNGDPVGNGYAGITVRSISMVTIGGTTAGSGNVISGNGAYGISILKIAPADPTPMNTTMWGNIIGADPTGTLARGNTSGGIRAGGNNLQIGAWNGGNRIMFNGGAGVGVLAGVSGVRIETNMIDANSGPGVDLGLDGATANDPGDTDTGANDLQNFLTVLSATNSGAGNTFATVDTNEIVAGTYLVEFFKSPTCDPSGYGEGSQSLIRFGITAQTGVIQLDLNSQVPAGWFVTTLVTSDATNNTSEFSNCMPVSELFVVAGSAGGQVNPNNAPTGTMPVQGSTLNPGQQAEIRADGVVQWYDGSGDSTPNGVGAPATPLDLEPALSAISLLYRFGTSGPWTFAGTGPITVTAPFSGDTTLYFAVNDSDYNDNSGAYNVYVKKQ